MDCAAVRTVLDAYALGELSGPLPAAVQAHLGGCRGCHAELQRQNRLTRLLAAVPVPAMPDNLMAHLLHTAQLRNQRRERLWRKGIAAAAVLVLGVVLGVFLSRTWPGMTAPVSGAVTLASGQVQTVGLEFHAGRELRGVQFSLRIPPGYALVGHERESQIAWTGELKPGHNLLQLHIMALDGRDGVLVATLRHGRETRIFRVKLHTAHTAARGTTVT